MRRYEVIGNTLLEAETIDQVFNAATGTNVSLIAIQKAVGELQLAYREHGFATVGVGLPPQQLTNAIVKVQVTEGRLVDIRVTGNHYFSSNNIVRALPTIREALLWKDQVLNSRVFQSELDLANQNRDRQIYPTLSPGPEPGTSALELKVKDRCPMHGRMDLDNYSTPGTPDWRINAAAQYNNLWQLEHQVGLSYGFTPEAFKAPGPVPNYLLNQPLISYGGAYYRMPFGSAESVQERINSSTRFGYDEATHQFRLPPAGSRPDLTVFASGSSSDTGVKLGPAVTISQTPLLTIVSQDSGRDLSLNAGAGSRLNVPLPLNEARRLNFSGGLDWKFYELQSFNTNNFVITTVVTNSQGSQIIESRIASPQPVRDNQVGYLPLALGADYFQTDPHGSFSASVGLSYNFVGAPSEFKALAYSREASANFGKATFALTRDQKLFKDWSLLLRASGQAATGPLINNEQFALGGVNSVRGYYEGDEYGDDGWFGSVELRTPFLATSAAGWTDVWPVWLRGSIFVDGGQRYLLDSRLAAAPTRALLGVGFGLSANINNHVDVRLAVGWPLRDSINTSACDPRVYVSLGGQF
ncbi:MAG: ShlB/FhaC/HecB family hemolysin secretion/activation protein [Verrucomicrobiota bacterium]